MSLTWHIVKKDLRALKWPLGFWVLVIVAKLGIGAMLLNADGTEGVNWFLKMDILARMLAGFEFVSFLLTAALIHGDPLVGTTAFWMTRPISGARLLRAKLCWLGLVFGLLPVLVTLPWWLGCGYGPHEIAWAAAETAAIHAAVVLLGLMWSPVVQGYGRFLMWTIVTLFAVPTLVGSIIQGLNHLLQSQGPSDPVMAARMTLGGGIAVAAILGAMIHQYLTLRTRRSITLLAGSAGLIVLVGVAWPWALNIDARVKTWLRQRAAGEWPAAAAPADLKFSSFRYAEVSGPGGRNGTAGKLRLDWDVEGLDIRRPVSGGTWAQLLQSYDGECSLRWPDGNVEPVQARARSGTGSRMDFIGPLPANLEQAQDLAAGHFTTQVDLMPAVAERFANEVPACTLTAHLRLMQFESVTPVSPTSGAYHATGSTSERIAHAEKTGEELEIVFIRRAASLGVDYLGGGVLAPPGPIIRYHLANKERRLVGMYQQIDHRETRIGTVGISWQTLAYRASNRPRAARPTLEAINALNDAELVAVTYREVARFSQEIRSDALQVRRVDPIPDHRP
ncbi:MAG TPA: hypothetical protein VG734_26525 [Lacunisphaera sp.]|nr:hypothetical protein [Lacunisphaera sp.]